VAAKYPEKVKEMNELFATEAPNYEVLPLDALVATRVAAPRPNITAGRSVFTYTTPMTGIPITVVAELFLHYHRRCRDTGRRSRGHDLDLRRPVWRLRFLPAQEQAGVPLEPGWPEASALGGSGRSRTRQAIYFLFWRLIKRFCLGRISCPFTLCSQWSAPKRLVDLSSCWRSRRRASASPPRWLLGAFPVAPRDVRLLPLKIFSLMPEAFR
jgi:hypothetical protein